MVFKPNYRFDRAERARSKEAKRQEKAARREAGRILESESEAAYGPQPIDQQEGHDGAERPSEI